MPTAFFLSTMDAHGPTAGGAAYATIEAALVDAGRRLRDGADAVSIVDRDGLLILPADQVRLRLHPIVVGPDAAGP